jgi:aminopeptidase N
MHGRTWAAVCGALMALILAAPASAQFSPGARTLGEPYLFLQHIGNGGYDVQHYDITIDYDPIAHSMVSSTAITARATQGLSEFSLDFVSYYSVASVKVNGVDATWTRDDDMAAYKQKLVITPAAGIPNGSTFDVVIAYSGTPQNFLDSDGSLEGFMRTTATLGSFTMNEPKGAMGWFPNNNHPRDKATFDFHLTAPNAYDAIGNGELASRVTNGDKTTWNWRMTYPMASYLSTSTIGLFDDTFYTGATARNPTGQPLNFHDFIESALPATGTGTANKANNNTQRVRQDAIVKFMADSIGAPYPFDSHGVVAGRAPGGGNYALEVQTKSHFGGGGISINTLAHEIAHQWFGDSVGPATWREIWFNEGWATWWATWWANKQNGSATTTATFFNNVYNQPASAWAMAPANLGSAENLFNTMPVYNRPAAMLEGYRQIVGDTAFFALQKAIVTEHAYSTITGDQFIALAKRIAAEKAGFEASNLAKLDAYFQQWLFGTVKPTLNPTTFFRSTSVPGDVSGTVPGTLALTVASTASLGNFTPGVASDYTSSLAANVTSTAGDATFTVVDPSTNVPGRLVNGAFSLAQPLNAGIGTLAPISDTPLTLKTYSGPVSNDQLTVGLRQSIGANEALRTGIYSKTLTFTLSTTSP